MPMLQQALAALMLLLCLVLLVPGPEPTASAPTTEPTPAVTVVMIQAAIQPLLRAALPLALSKVVVVKVVQVRLVETPKRLSKEAYSQSLWPSLDCVFCK